MTEYEKKLMGTSVKTHLMALGKGDIFRFRFSNNKYLVTAKTKNPDTIYYKKPSGTRCFKFNSIYIKAVIHLNAKEACHE